MNYIFEVESAVRSKLLNISSCSCRGVVNINKEIFSAEDNPFILHDSWGYGTGELKNF